jgi:hypothetical protein
MKRVLFLFFELCLSLLSGVCLGQEVVTPLDSAAERKLITAQRDAQESHFQQLQQGCYQRFAVNDCLIEVRRERRGVLDELRRREILLNDLERQSQAIDELNRIQANLSPERQEQTLQQADQARQEAIARQTRNDDKKAARLNAPVQAPQKSPADQASPSPSESARNERAYLDKLAEAQRRKADLEQRLRQQGKASSGLPVPN